MSLKGLEVGAGPASPTPGPTIIELRWVHGRHSYEAEGPQPNWHSPCQRGGPWAQQQGANHRSTRVVQSSSGVVTIPNLSPSSVAQFMLPHVLQKKVMFIQLYPQQKTMTTHRFDTSKYSFILTWHLLSTIFIQNHKTKLRLLISITSFSTQKWKQKNPKSLS